MRKQHHSNPPELKRGSRLNNSVVGSRRCKRPNALKHGVFSDAVLIPGEDSGEYKQLLAELMEEWNPVGRTLRQAVVGLANLLHKQSRLNRFVQTKLTAAMFDPRSPTFNQAWGLANFAYRLCSEPETCFERYASTYLRPDKIEHLEERFPRLNYQSTSDWIEAIRKEIFSVLIPDLSEFDPPEPGKQADEMMEALRQWKDDCQVAGTITVAGELLEYEFTQGERLEARIIRQTRYCAELKAWEEAEEMRSKT